MTIAELTGGPGRRGRLRGAHEAQAAHEVRRAVPRARARRPDRDDRGARLERRRAARRALRRRRRGARARPRREVPRPAAARRAHARGGGRRPGRRSRRRCGATRTSSRGSSSSWSPSSPIPGLPATVRSGARRLRPRRRFPATPDDHHSYAGGLLEHTVGVATLCRETAQLHPRLRGDLLLAAALVHDVGRTLELGRGPAFASTDEGRLLGHVHLGLRLIEERADGLTAGAAGRAPALRRGAPRRARGAHGRGGRALPREPARRGRGRPAGSIDPAPARARREPRLGRRRLRRPAGQPDARRRCRVLLWAQVGGVARASRSLSRSAATGPPAGRCCSRSARRSAGCSASSPTTAAWRRRDERRRADRRRLGGRSRSSSASRPGDRPVARADRRDRVRARRRRARVARAPARGSGAWRPGVGLALLAALGFGFYFPSMHAAGKVDFWWASLVFRTTALLLVAGGGRRAAARRCASAGATLAIVVARRHRRHDRERALRRVVRARPRQPDRGARVALPGRDRAARGGRPARAGRAAAARRDRADARRRRPDRASEPRSAERRRLVLAELRASRRRRAARPAEGTRLVRPLVLQAKSHSRSEAVSVQT